MRPRLPDMKLCTSILFSLAILLSMAAPLPASAAGWVRLGTFTSKGVPQADEYYAPATVHKFPWGAGTLVRENIASDPPRYWQVVINCHTHQYAARQVFLTDTKKIAFGPIIGPRGIVEGSDAAALELYLCST